MNEIMMMFTAAVYAVFLRNLLFSGGLGTSEMIRAAERNSEIMLTSMLISGFSMATAAISRGATVLINSQRDVAGGFFHWRFSIFTLPYTWYAAIYGVILLSLYLLVNLTIALLPLKHKRILHKRMGMSVLNTLVMSVPLLVYREGKDLLFALGLGLGAGVAFYIVTMLVNSGMFLLHENKAIPPMFTGVPATLIYTGLLALAFTGFTGKILFQ